MCMLSCFSHVWLFVTLWTMAHQVGFCLWDSPGKNTGMGCPALLQGIFLTQGLNPCLLHCRWILNVLRHWGSPKYIVYSWDIVFVLTSNSICLKLCSLSLIPNCLPFTYIYIYIFFFYHSTMIILVPKLTIFGTDMFDSFFISLVLWW